MARKLPTKPGLWTSGLSASVLASALISGVAQAQVAPPAVPNLPEAPAATDKVDTDSTLGTAQDATNTATSTAQDAAKSASDAAKSASDAARDSAKSATDTARDATRSATNQARDASKTARDAAKKASDSTRDATRNATNQVRDASKNAADATRDAQRSTRDAVRNTRDATGNATKSARDAAGKATDDVRDAARSTTRNARDAAQDATRDTRDAVRDTRDAAQDITRDAQDTARDAAQDVRETTRDAVDDVRRTTRDAANAAIDETRDTVRANTNIRTSGSQSFQASNFRGPDLGIWFDRSVRDGLVIADVATNAALANVGFMEGDRIVSVNGRTITSEPDFMRYVFDPNVRDRMNVIVLRDGQQQTLYLDPVVIRERVMTVDSDPLERFGIILDDRVADRIVVWRVIPRSPAFYAGIRPGDVLTMFAGQQIAAPSDFVQIVSQTEPGLIPVQVTRNGRVRQIEVDYPQVEVSNRQSTFRQDLDVEPNISTEPGAARTNTNVRGQLNTDADANLRNPSATVRGDVNARSQADTDLPAAPNSTDVSPAREPAPSARGYSGSGSNNYRRGLFRRRN